jgi:hypothetical protein
VGAVPSVDYFVNHEIPLSKYLECLLPILEPSLNVLRQWTFLFSSRPGHSPNSSDYSLRDFTNMGRKESDVAQETDTFYPGLWRTKTTRADESQLREKYSIPTSVQLRFGSENEGAMVRSDEHEICLYEDMFEIGFRLPFPKIVRELLHYLQIAPHQLAPNAWRTLFACIILWPRVLGEGHELSIREFLKIYRPLRNPKTEYVFNFQGRQKVKFILLPGYSSNKHWKERFFFAQGAWECLTTETVADPEVPRKVRRLLSSKQDEPVLTEDEAAHVRELLRHSEKYVAEMDFDAIFSQSALAARLQYPPTVRVAESKPKLKKKRKATVLQTSEPRPTGITRLEAPILSPAKSSSGVNVREKSGFSQEETFEPNAGLDTPTISKKQKVIPEIQRGEVPPSSEFTCIKTSLINQLSAEIQHKEISPTSRPDIAQHSLVEPSLIVASPSLGSPVPLAEDVTIDESSTQPLAAPSPVHPTYLSRKTREEKGKDVAKDDTLDNPATEGLGTDLLSDSMADRAKDETQRDSSRGEVEGEQLGKIAKTRSDEMPEDVRAKFLSSMFKSRMFTQKGQTTASNPSDTRCSQKATICEERGIGIITVEGQGNMLMAPLLNAPCFPVPADVGSLSDSDKETEQYLERMLMNASTESPFAQISPLAEATENLLRSDPSGGKGAGASTAKEVSALVSGEGEIRTISMADYESRLRREGSIISQVATDASPVGGSLSGRTPNAIYWSVSETLNRLGEKWLGNPLTVLVGLIPAPAMAKVKAMTSQETVDHMIFHLVDVSASYFGQII